MERNVRILDVSTDYGANRRGVDMGPSTIRYAGFVRELKSAGVSPTDASDLAVPHRTTWGTDAGATDAKHVKEAEEVMRSLADVVSTTFVEGTTSPALSGDHSIAAGSLVGSARDTDIDVIWSDTHDDFNTSSISPSDNVHGIPLAAMLGIGDFAGAEWANTASLKEENVAIVSSCFVDDAEAEATRDSGVTVYTISDIDECGIIDVTSGALGVTTNGTGDVHISLGLDWPDPREAPGVRTPVRGGVTYREAHAVVELTTRSEAMRSLELVEVNPILDEHNETVTLATELIAGAFDRRTL